MNDQIQIDLGTGILFLDSEISKRGSPIVTAYVNNLSIRTSLLHIERVRDNFIDTVMTACVIADADVEQRVEDEIIRTLDSPNFTKR